MEFDTTAYNYDNYPMSLVSNNHQLTSALYSWRGSEGCPQLLGAQVAASGHVEADGHKLVPFDHHGHTLVTLVGVGQHGRRGVILRLP